MIPTNRPLSVKILASIYFLAGVSSLSIGSLLASGNEIMAEILETRIGFTVAITYVLMGIASITVARGFWDGWWVMWYLGILLNLAAIGFSAWLAINDGIYATVAFVVAVLFLASMFAPKVKRFFRIRGKGLRKNA